MTPSQNRNLLFWTSQIRAKHLHLLSLLKVINSHCFDEETHEILYSLIDKIIKENLALEPQPLKSCIFIKAG